MDTDSGRNKCIWRPQNIGDKLISSFAGQRKLSIMETYPRILFYSGRCYQRYTWWYHLLWNAFHWDKFSKWSKAAESPALLGLTTGIRPKEQFGWLLWWEDICQLLSASYLKDQSILSCNRTAAREAPIPLSIDTFFLPLLSWEWTEGSIPSWLMYTEYYRAAQPCCSMPGVLQCKSRKSTALRQSKCCWELPSAGSTLVKPRVSQRLPAPLFVSKQSDVPVFQSVSQSVWPNTASSSGACWSF